MLEKWTIKKTASLFIFRLVLSFLTNIQYSVSWLDFKSYQVVLGFVLAECVI